MIRKVQIQRSVGKTSARKKDRPPIRLVRDKYPQSDKVNGAWEDLCLLPSEGDTREVFDQWMKDTNRIYHPGITYRVLEVQTDMVFEVTDPTPPPPPAGQIRPVLGSTIQNGDLVPFEEEEDEDPNADRQYG